MAQGVKNTARCRNTVSAAWRRGDDTAVVRAVVAKYAKVIDACDSARDMKPLASGMFEAIDRLRAIEAKDQAAAETPLGKIIMMDECLRAASGE